ncbi:MAG TPA: sensor histidine kinase [Burkholderiaceae bacterium]
MQVHVGAGILERSSGHGPSAATAIPSRFGLSSLYGPHDSTRAHGRPARHQSNDQEGWTALLSALFEQRAITAQARDALASMIVNARAAAIAQERERVARELHDGVAQAFIGIKMLLSAGPSAAGEAIKKAQRLAQQGLRESRRAIHALLPAELVSSRLDVAVRRMASAVVPTHMALQVESTGDWSALPQDQARELFRMVQEAVNNAVKHSRASRLAIDLSCNDRDAVALISDDGRGFNASRCDDAGFGLMSMRQRAQRTGGRIDIVSAVGSGTQIFISIALNKTPAS